MSLPSKQQQINKSYCDPDFGSVTVEAFATTVAMDLDSHKLPSTTVHFHRRALAFEITDPKRPQGRLVEAQLNKSSIKRLKKTTVEVSVGNHMHKKRMEL